VGGLRRPEARQRPEPSRGSTDRAALWTLFATYLALETALVAAGWTLLKYLPNMQLPLAQKVMLQVGLLAAFVAFGWRGLSLWRRLRK
jgi:hypothetical protein